jgi:hypothetical protein
MKNMPVPALITDLSIVPGSNSPAGSESPSLIDDYLRTQAAFIAQLRDGALIKSSPLVGATTNLYMTVSAASATATVAADEIVVGTALGATTYRLANFSKTINLATTGINAMDTGTAPVSGWVAIYAIYNPTTSTSALLGVNSPNTFMPTIYGGANMPAGYTASALLTVVPTNASSQFKVCAVRGRKVYIQLNAAFIGSPVNANTAITTIVPANAIEITNGELIIQSTLSSTMSLTVISQLGTLLGQQNMSATLSANVPLTGNFGAVPLTVPQNLGIIGNSTAGTPTYSVYVSGYSI